MGRVKGKKSTAGDRVRRLLDEHWNGNQSEMARDINCAQSTLSLVASGKNEPGKRLLTLIANHEEINADWLFHGSGKPFAAHRPIAKKNDALRIFDRPLIVLPAESDDAFTGRLQEVLPHQANHTSYFLRVHGTDPVTTDYEIGIRAGDRLLIDMSAIPRVERLFRKLCVIRNPRNADEACLALVSYCEASVDNGPERIEADTFDLGIGRAELHTETKTVELRGKKRSVQEHFRKVHEPEGIRLEPLSHVELEPTLHQIKETDILGICKLMLRTTF